MVSKLDGPVGWIPGHSFCAPYGARVEGQLPEYFVNRQIITQAQVSAIQTGFENYVMVDWPATERSIGAIGPQLREIEYLRCPFSLEVHCNYSANPRINYGVAFYKQGDLVGQRFAVMLAAALKPGLGVQVGLSDFHVIDIPHPKWPAYKAIVETKVPLVLIEPFFLSSDNVKQWLKRANSLQWLGSVIERTSRLFSKELRDGTKKRS